MYACHADESGHRLRRWALHYHEPALLKLPIQVRGHNPGHGFAGVAVVLPAIGAESER
jgi:hypothetical protein